MRKQNIHLYQHVVAAGLLMLLHAGLMGGRSQAATLTPGEYRQQSLAAAVRSAERNWRNLDNPPPSLGVRELFLSALAYCEARTNLDCLERIFVTAAKMQDRNPTNRSYGNFRWSWGHEAVYDYNAVDFCMQTAAMLWIHHREIMPSRARTLLGELIDYGLEGLRRHRVAEQYTNIALMNAGDLILLGEALGKASMAEEGYARLDRFLIAMWEGGTHEYDSPTYYGVDLEDLELIEAFCQQERGKQQARALLEYFWTDIALNWFPAAQKLGGTRSRDYDYLRGLGVLDQHLLANGWLAVGDKDAPNNLLATYSKWAPPERLLALANSRFPRYVQQVWGFESYQGRAQYVCRDVSLSAAGASYGGRMDLPLTVDLPGPRQRPRCYFIADGRQDPYGKNKIPESKAHSKTIHLNPFWAAAQRKADALGLVVYRENDLTPTNETLQSHFVMPLDVDAFWIGQRQVKFTASQPAEYPVAPGEAVVLRQGPAAVGVRVLWSRGLDGRVASAALVYDGNAFGAVRLTIKHHSSQTHQFAGTNAGAAMWVRVGSGLDAAAFAEWKRQFASAQGKGLAGSTGIVATVTGMEGPLTVAASSPFNKPSKLEPPYPRLLLAVDGDDVGHKLLEGVEPIKSFTTASVRPVNVPASGTVSWEAEDGRMVPPFCAGPDPQASRSKFAWMPAEPGERANSSIGQAAYTLRVSRAGDYFLWGRVRSPTPENDSFFVRVLQDGEPLLENTAWPLGVHKQWSWTRLNSETGKKPLPLPLPAGEVTLQIRVREAGAQLDQLFLTANPSATPPR